MAIDKTIYNNGINGMLSYWEIENLPRDYEVFKAMFKEATEIKEGKRKVFETTSVFEKETNKPMSRLKQEKRMLQVLSRATYGMNKYNCEYVDKISKRQSIYGYDPSNGTEKMSFKSRLSRFVFYLNPKRLWGIISLYWNLRKLWSEDRKRYREAEKQLKVLRKEQKKQYDDMQYNMDRKEWVYRGTC